MTRFQIEQGSDGRQYLVCDTREQAQAVGRVVEAVTAAMRVLPSAEASDMLGAAGIVTFGYEGANVGAAM